MKIDRIITSLIVLLMGLQVHGQTVVDRTNQIQLDLSKSQKATKLPQINWELPRLEFTNSEESRVDVKANVTSVVPLKRVSLSILSSLDGEPKATINIDFENNLYASVEKNIFLQDGQNYVQVVAENIDGGTVVDNRSIVIGMDALKDALAIDRQDYALLFATDQYDNWGDLVNPIDDSEAIAKELEERYGFKVEIVKNGDQDMVFNSLRDYAKRSYKPQDQLFIFFAGHGVYDETFGEGFVVARDSRANDPGKNSYISHNRLRSNIDNINCEHIMLVMDVCFGGTFDPVLASSRNLYEEMDNEEYIAKKLSTKTRKFLTSGGKEYVSDGIPGKHSPFTVRLLEALKSNGGEDRLLTFSEVNLYMQRLKTTARFGPFGSDQQGSEFLFIAN